MLKVTVSGVRGLIGDGLTPRVAMQFGMAFGTVIKGKKVIVGRDTRASGKVLKNALFCGLVSSGCEVVDLGICPTPTVLLQARKEKCYGIVITASHNPQPWNGLKFANKDGTFLNKRQMNQLHNIYKAKKFNTVIDCEDVSEAVCKDDKALDLHINEVLKNLNKNLIRKQGFKVACDFCNGTGAVITKKFLSKLGCKAYTINDEPNGRFAHNPEPTPKNLRQLSRLVKRKKADIGIAQDPDADRLALCDEKGVAIGEENTLSLAVKAILRKKKGKVVVNASTSKSIDKITQEFGVKLIRTAVGEINVVERMRKAGALIGGEGNGGVIYPKVNLCRDSFVGIGIILQYMAETKKTLSELVRGITQYKMVKGKIHCTSEEAKSAVDNLKKKFKSNELDLVDGIKIIWPQGWVHLRPSNTEPIIRIIAEAKTVAQAKKLYNAVKKNIKG